jgi:Zn-dependent M28 family amino/carboxypeptidase
LAPGADDNASGTAAVMEAARILANQSFDFTVKFICFSAEEWGLYGSQDYAVEARQRGEDIVAVINLDMIAYTDSIPEDLDIIGNQSSEWLADRFFSTAVAYTTLDIYKIINPSFNRSDHSSFWDSGYSAILGIEDAFISNPYYHRTSDTIDTLNLDFITEVAKASLATAADLAQPVSSPQTPTGITSRSQVISSLFSSIKTAFLDWDTNQDPVIGYNIYRTTASHSDYQRLNSSPLVQTYYMDENLDADTPYYYVVTSVDSLDNESNYSKEVVDDEGNETSNSFEKSDVSEHKLHALFVIRRINLWI